MAYRIVARVFGYMGPLRGYCNASHFAGNGEESLIVHEPVGDMKNPVRISRLPGYAHSSFESLWLKDPFCSGLATLQIVDCLDAEVSKLLLISNAASSRCAVFQFVVAQSAG